MAKNIKLQNLIQEITHMEINVQGISNVQWADTGKLTANNGMMFYAGNSDPAHCKGAAILLDKEINKSVISFNPYII